MEKITVKKVSSSFFWRILERFGAQAITLIVSIVLARLLEPSVYGTVAIVLVFTSIFQIFVDGGFGNALVQKKNSDEIDFSSVFYFNLVFCATFYIILFFTAPFIASFYNRSELTLIIRVLGISVIVSGLKNIQQAYVSKHFLFRLFFFSTLGGTIGAAVVGIILAYFGFGVWALVVQYLFNLIVDTTILWITVKWRPKRVFSFQRLKNLFKYGWKLLIANFSHTLVVDIRSLIVGKYYSSEDLAFYNRGNQFPQIIATNISTSIESVLFPALSAEQDDKNRVLSITRRSIKTSTYIIFPIMIGLAVCAEPIVRLILTEKWLPAVFFLRIFCVTFAFYPIASANLSAVKAIGRSDILLILELLKNAISIGILFSTIWISVEAMAFGLLLASFVNQFINSLSNKVLLHYRFSDQFFDILPNILISFFMGLLVFKISSFGLNDFITLLVQVPTGILLYIILSKIFKIESFDYSLEIARSFLKKEKVDKRGIL